MHRIQPLSHLARVGRPLVRLTNRGGAYPTTPAALKIGPRIGPPSRPLSCSRAVQASVQTGPTSTSGASSRDGQKTQKAPKPEMGSSLDQLVPKSLFEAPNATDGVAILDESLARPIVEVILTQLRRGVDATSLDEVQGLQREADDAVLSILRNAHIPAASLHHFATNMLRISKDPRKTPIAFRLFGIAFGVEPSQLDDPTSSASPLAAGGLDSSLASVPVAGKDAFGVNAAGYSWASMVLSGQSPPPPGIHLLANGSKEYIAAIAQQQAAAVRVYATLAMRGDAQGMLGMGRVLMAGTQREVPVPGKSGEESEREVKVMRDRAVALWTKAGQLGVGDAWFELGLLSLGSTRGVELDEGRSRSYFEMGAKEGNFRSHHALGVMHTQAAMADNQTPSRPEREEQLSKSLHHFTSAAEMGDPQSAHNVGLRYLLRDETVEEVGVGRESDGRTDEEVMKQASQRHRGMWGVEPNDVEARKWFARAADLGSVPAMMNFAGMLVEARGSSAPPISGAEVRSQEDAARVMIQARLEDLKRAESLYSRVAAHGSMMAQQQQQQSPASKKDGGVDQGSGSKEANVGEEMAKFSQEALSTVRLMIEQLAEEANKVQAGKMGQS